jgi:hypothetical protein
MAIPAQRLPAHEHGAVAIRLLGRFHVGIDGADEAQAGRPPLPRRAA